MRAPEENIGSYLTKERTFFIHAPETAADHPKSDRLLDSEILSLHERRRSRST